MCRPPLALPLALALAALTACGGGAATPGDVAAGARVAIRVAPLDLAGVTDVTYRLTVTAGAATVWTKDVRSSDYGDGAGSLTYVGPCDATAANTVGLEILEIRDATRALTDPGDFKNPAPAGSPITRPATCSPDADTAVAFDLTVLRRAQQGFFDVAVTFDDVFCSAKIDCERDGGGALDLLFDPDGGGRVPSVVLGFACTAGVGAATHLWLDRPTLTCGGVPTRLPIDGDAAGNVYTANPAGPVRQLAVYRGREQLTDGAGASFEKLYANVALAVDPGAACSLSAVGTASDGAFTDLTTPSDAYPLIRWEIAPLTDATRPVCGQRGLDDPGEPEGQGVFTDYTRGAAHVFDLGVTADPEDAAGVVVLRSGISCGDGRCEGAETGVSCPEDCLAVCPAGLRGAACDTPCADAPRCTGAVTCDRYGDGAPTACEGCVAGTWGTTCASDCALATCAGVVSCDPDDGVVTGCTQCAAGWFGALCDSDWYDPAFAYRAPLTVTASDYSGAASYVHVPVDVDAICYGTRLPPTLYSFGLDEGPGGDHVDSLDGHGGFAPLEHGGAFVAGHDGRGSALSLNGASDWVDLPDVVPSTGTMTLAAWVRPSALPTTGYPAVVSAWGTVNVSGGEVYLMALAQDAACSNGDGQGGVRLMMKTHPVGQAEHSECTAKIAADSWVFAALTYSGRVERSYLDGAQQTSHDYGSSAGLEAASAVRLGLARDLATHFAGAVDDVRLYDGYLDDTDVQALMAPRCRRDLGDLRFVDRATGALLPYWAESDHRVQLRVPVASLAHTIDVYYGAPDAASGSDGDATFDFFEDFSGGLDKWTVTSGCSGSGAATLRYGKLEGTGDCAVLTSTASLDGLRRNAYMDLFRDGTETAACADGRVGFGGINVFAIPRLNLAGADQVNLGTRTTCGGNAGQPDQLDLGTIGLVQGHSDYFEAAWYPLRGTLFALTYAGYQFATAKGAVEVHATGSASTPRWYDNVRVTSPATTSSSSFGAPCRQATGSCASYRWIDLGPRTEPLTVRACPANGKSSTQTCNAANLGRRVHIDTDLPSAIKFKGFTDTVPAGVVPGGAGTAATLSPDGTSLLWSATWANCPEESVAMVTVEHVYECQLVE